MPDQDTHEEVNADPLLTLVAIAVLVYAPAIFLHELGHAVAAVGVGGDPTLLSSTDMRANLEAVDRWGFVAIGVAGSAVNWLLAAVGWCGLRVFRRVGLRWTSWLLAAVNGFIPAWYMAISPLIGFGDWMTIVSRFEAQVPLRLAFGGLGWVLTWLWWRAMASELLALTVDAAEHDSSVATPLSRARLSWLSGGGLALLAATLSPLGLVWALPLAAGSTLGTTWPMLPAGRQAGRSDTASRGLPPISQSRVTEVIGGLVALAFVLIVGRGIAL